MADEKTEKDAADDAAAEIRLALSKGRNAVVVRPVDVLALCALVPSHDDVVKALHKGCTPARPECRHAPEVTIMSQHIRHLMRAAGYEVPHVDAQ